MYTLNNLIERYPALESSRQSLEKALDMMIQSCENDGTLFFCGNGGSASDAEHIVGELLKDFMIKRPLSTDDQNFLRESFGEKGAYLANNLQQGIRAIALTSHPSFNTAISNDVFADLSFAQQLNCLGKEGDVLMGISTSGNSINVLHAARIAKLRGIKVIALSGKSGGQLAKLSDEAIVVAEDSVPFIQELHLPIYHWFCIELERHFFG